MHAPTPPAQAPTQTTTPTYRPVDDHVRPCSDTGSDHALEITTIHTNLTTAHNDDRHSATRHAQRARAQRTADECRGCDLLWVDTPTLTHAPRYTSRHRTDLAPTRVADCRAMFYGARPRSCPGGGVGYTRYTTARLEPRPPS